MWPENSLRVFFFDDVVRLTFEGYFGYIVMMPHWTGVREKLPLILARQSQRCDRFILTALTLAGDLILSVTEEITAKYT